MTKKRILPESGLPRPEILQRLAAMKHVNANWHAGRTWSLVYHESDPHHNFLQDAYQTHFSENGLNPTAFPSLQQMELDITAMAATLFHAPDTAAGTLQSGGTESILCAMLTYRDRARKKGIKQPELVLSETAHVAFHKAAHYFGFALNLVPVDAEHRVDPAAFKQRIGKNTMAVVVSAPAYPSGQLDPIEAIAAITTEAGVSLHVDACVGGFFLPFLPGIQPWDFHVPGVTSISADLHKYGFSAKGASVLIWRDRSWLEDQLFVYANWPGGVYASAGLLGTRPGGAYAAAWATLLAHGESGYRELVSGIMETTGKIQSAVASKGFLNVLGTPEMSVFALVSARRDLSVYAVADVLEEKGWFIDRQLRPESIHFTVTPAHAPVADQFIADLNVAVETVLKEPGRTYSGKAAQYGLISHLPARSMVEGEVRKTMTGLLTGTGTAEPDIPFWQRWVLRIFRRPA